MPSINPYDLTRLEPSEHFAVASIVSGGYPAMMDNIIPNTAQITQQRVHLLGWVTAVRLRQPGPVFLFPQGIYGHDPLPPEERLDRPIVLDLPYRLGEPPFSIGKPSRILGPVRIIRNNIC